MKRSIFKKLVDTWSLLCKGQKYEIEKREYHMKILADHFALKYNTTRVIDFTKINLLNVYIEYQLSTDGV